MKTKEVIKVLRSFGYRKVITGYTKLAKPFGFTLMTADIDIPRQEIKFAVIFMSHQSFTEVYNKETVSYKDFKNKEELEQAIAWSEDRLNVRGAHCAGQNKTWNWLTNEENVDL
jgi:hypothetical protein